MGDEAPRSPEEPAVPLQPEQIQAILRYLPVFEHLAWQYAQPRDDESDSLSRYRDGATSAFVSELYAIGVIQPFDWMKWDRAPEISGPKASLDWASLGDIHKLLIGHVRFDRFCTGHLELMVEEGDLVRVLRRLSQIVSSAAPPAD